MSRLLRVAVCWGFAVAILGCAAPQPDRSPDYRMQTWCQSSTHHSQTAACQALFERIIDEAPCKNSETNQG